MKSTTINRPVAALGILVLGALLAGNAFARLPQGDIEAGKNKAVVCQACHGADGNATTDPQYARLAGQWGDYLVHSLKAYRSGERADPVMGAFAKPLSDEDIDDLASYYASLEPSMLHDLTKAARAGAAD